MPEQPIKDNEELYRGIVNSPDFWPIGLDRPSTALFKDSKGVSVDRDGQRDELEIRKTLCANKEFKALAKITAIKCRQAETHPVPKRIPENFFHAEIHDSPNQIQIKARGKLKKLIDSIVIIDVYKEE